MALEVEEEAVEDTAVDVEATVHHTCFHLFFSQPTRLTCDIPGGGGYDQGRGYGGGYGGGQGGYGGGGQGGYGGGQGGGQHYSGGGQSQGYSSGGQSGGGW